MIVRELARKELLDVARDGRLRTAAIAVACLMIIASVAGWNDHRRYEREQAEQQQRSRAQWEGQGAKNPHTAAHFGLYVHEPHGALAMIDRGLTPYVGRAIWIEAHNQNTPKFRPIEDATALGRLGVLDAALILQVVLPLLIVVLAHGAFAAERDAGTMRQLLVTRARPSQLVVGKLLGLAMAISRVAAPGLVTIGLLLVAAKADMADVVPAMMMGVSYLLYFYIVLALTLAVSVFATNARTALAVTMAGWVIVTVIVPRIAADVAGVLEPTPSPTQFWSAVDRDLAGNEERTQALERSLLERYNVTTVAELPLSFEGAAMQAGEEHGNAVFDDHYGRLYASYAAQARDVLLFGAASPLLALRAVSGALAGTDMEMHRAFVEQAEAYRRRVQATLNGYIRDHARSGDWGLRADASFWRELPVFDFERPPWETRARGLALGVGLLAAWGIVATLALVLASRRVRP